MSAPVRHHSLYQQRIEPQMFLRCQFVPTVLPAERRNKGVEGEGENRRKINLLFQTN